MSTASQFDMRRRERQRRQRIRKKRIRAAILLIILIGIIILAFVACSNLFGNSNPENQTDTGVTEVTPEPSVPTALPQSSTSYIPPASEGNDLLKIINNSGHTNRCYLTFDDGPTKNITPQILDTLRRYNVKATFFQIGSLIDANPDMARRVYEEGHLIANHSSGHNYGKLYASTSSFMSEINDCYEKIKSVGNGEEPFKLIRFPGGGYNSSADSYAPVKQDCKVALKESGFYYCDWNALNGDAEGKQKNAQELLQYLKRNMDVGENVVVLMHDAGTKQATADSLASIIEYLSSEGYTFHRLDDIDYQVSSSSPSPSPESGDDESGDDENSTPAPSPSAAPTSRPTVPPSSGGAIIIQ